jgi:serine/threonine-protein kinase
LTTPTTPPVDPYGATTPLPQAAASGAEPVALRPARTTSAIETRGLSLSARIFMGVAGTVLLVLALTLIVGGASSQRAAQNSIDAGLEQTGALITSLLADEEEDMAARSRIFFTNAAYRSEIEKTGLDTPGGAAVVVDSADFLDLLTTVLEETGGSWAQLTDRNGVRLARSDVPGGEAIDLSESPMIARALNGETVRGFGKTGDTTLFDAVSVPITGAGSAVIGVAMVARTIGDSAARRVKRLTGSEAIYFAFDSLENPRIVGVSDTVLTREQLAALIPSLIRANRGSEVDSGAPLRQQLMSMQMDSSGATMAREGKVASRSYVWRIRPLLTAGGNPTGGVLTLRDKDQALAPFTRMQRAVLSAGAIALALAFLISFFVARQITQPVRGLVEATRRAAEGDYAAQIPAARGEIGALAAAFNLLLEDLREKQALVDFLQGTSGDKTVAAQAARMGMGATNTTAPRGMGGGRMLAPGETLANRYEIKKVLGAGGMGMVYKALDRELGETVAVKTLRPEFMEADANALERFRSEIRLARRISHRNVVRTHDIGEVDGLYFITMEFVEGSSLKDLIVSRGRLPAAAVVSIGKQLCRALEVAHEAGVIHRDIKPQNMVVEADGTLKVMDFGIARLQARSDGHTQAGMVVGTPEYMSPEQLRGDELDGRSDLYSAGAVLYESLTGRLPLSADTPASLIGKVLTEMPVPPRASVAEVSPLLSSSIMQALEKDREKRPRTALEFLSILDRA